MEEKKVSSRIQFLGKFFNNKAHEHYSGAGGARWSSEDMPEEEVLLSGFLDKQNPNGLLGKKAWKRRFFILKSESLTYYVGDAPDAEELRRVDVQKLKDIKARDDIGHGHCFELRTNLFMDNGKPRVYILSAKDKKVTDEWIEALEASVERARSGKKDAKNETSNAAKHPTCPRNSLPGNVLELVSEEDEEDMTPPAAESDQNDSSKSGSRLFSMRDLKSPVDSIRNLVSKKKKRFQSGGFDLDLAYVTDRVIAMGFPSEGVEAGYRNPLPEVYRFLETRHSDHYMIYNLCSERSYDPDKFHGRVMSFPFDDHSPPPFELMRPCVSHVCSFLDEDVDNVVALHCKAGKGRTGVMAVAYLLHNGQCKTAQEAIDFFARARTHDGKGVTIPSQKRYCQYFAENLGQTRGLKAIRIGSVTVTHCPPSSFVNPSLTVAAGQDVVKVNEALYDTGTETLTFRVNFNFIGDIKIMMQDEKAGPFHHNNNKACFWCWIHSSFVNGRLVLKKSELDGPMKKDMKKHERFDAGLVVTINVSGCKDASRLVDAPGSGISGGGSCCKMSSKKVSEEDELLLIDTSLMKLMRESSETSSQEDQVVATTRNRCSPKVGSGMNRGASTSGAPNVKSGSGSDGAVQDSGRFNRFFDTDSSGGFAQDESGGFNKFFDPDSSGAGAEVEESPKEGCLAPDPSPSVEGPKGAREAMLKMWKSGMGRFGSGSKHTFPSELPGLTGVVLYDFDPQGSSSGTLFQENGSSYEQLSIRANDIIDLVQPCGKGWWLAIVDGKLGIVPQTYIVATEVRSDAA